VGAHFFEDEGEGFQEELRAVQMQVEELGKSMQGMFWFLLIRLCVCMYVDLFILFCLKFISRRWELTCCHSGIVQNLWQFVLDRCRALYVRCL